MGVPLLDASQLHAGGEARKAYLHDLIKSFQDYGFVRLTNHGVPAKKVKEVFDWAERVFQLQIEDKMKFVNIADGSPQRGYSAVGTEKTASLYGKMIGRDVSEDLTDAREHFDCGSPNDMEHRNRWPTNLPGFQSEMESFYILMEQCAADILSALEEGLGTAPSTFNSMITHNHNASELRLNHYPPIPAATLRGGQVSRIWPHFDLGVITLLFTSSVGGLEVEDRRATEPQTFIPVEPETEAELIVNISETLQRWTDDQLPAGLHRVSIPRELIDTSNNTEIPRRYSVAYLCKADRQAPVGTIPVFTTGDAPRYKGMTASEYHRSRLLAAY
ncbi:Clavaminate synthase-like protein [Zopfia rhizophila CBS 207.26]|uniref:Clavaminate synthase-like protein n=1 Tax=Zopfia rhizophila CBS 207.26 TaxID=1314779 RepID=A0A6A6DGC0_9PEZI|nr:Clavaminate synthase-like protein [Zopfia rhizophila CBS 207.26]